VRYLFLIITSLLFTTSIALAQKVAFKNYSVSSGLPSSEVYMIYQDTKGYIWFCTDAGVCKFDGYVLKHIQVKMDYQTIPYLMPLRIIK